MDYISVFISYSSTQKHLAGRLKYFLQTYCGYNIFLAHDDLPGGIVWEDAVKNAIKACDIFIPLISEAFKQSDFTDQEIGMATCLRKRVIPIKLEKLNPYGFINKYQALQYKIYSATVYRSKSDNLNELALAIGQIGLSYNTSQNFNEKIINSLVAAFYNSKSFESTNGAIQLMRKCTTFSAHHLYIIKKAVKNNSQVGGAYGLDTLRNFLRETYQFDID